MNTELEISLRGLQLIMQFEGFSAKVYKDVAGYPTIGYGHKITADESYTAITHDEAQRLLRNDITDAEDAVRILVKTNLTQSQYDALVSFVYNVGAGAFKSSTLLRQLNAGNYARAAKEFMRWNKIRKHGVMVESAGLTARRAVEAVIFQEKSA